MESRGAVELAANLAAHYRAELHSISVEEHLPKYAATIDEVDGVREQKNHYFEQVNREAEMIAAAQGADLQAHVVPGHEVETIINFCREGGFDLLVVGFMGHSRIYERIWGSTSQTLIGSIGTPGALVWRSPDRSDRAARGVSLESLTRLAPCSVLVAK